MFQSNKIPKTWKSGKLAQKAGLLSFFFLFIIAQRTLAVASDFYISTSGSDSNACSQAAPCATFNHVDSFVQPGDTVHVMSGTYNLNSSNCIVTATSGTSSASITWQSDVHGAAKINGNGACLYMWHATGSYQKILGFDFTGVQNNSNPASAVILAIGTDGNHEIAYNTFHDLTGYFGAAVITQPGLDGPPPGYSGAPCSIHDNVFYNIAVGFNSTENHYSIYNTCGTNTTIYNNVIYNEGSQAITNWHAANNVHIYNNTIDHSYYGILVGTGDAGAVNGAYFDVTNNIVTNTTVSIEADDSAPGLISSSSVFRNNLLFNNATDWFYNNNGTDKSITSSFTVSGTVSGKDPLFVAPSSGNYRVQSGSPAIGAGLETSYTPVLDLAGATRPNPPSIGAYESGTPVVIPPVGNINTIAGNGTQGYSGDNGVATSAELGQPPDVAVDSVGNIYIADAGNNVIRKVTASTGIITTVAGTGAAGYTGDGGAATSATLNFPFGLAVDGNGNLYIADANNQAIRKVTASTGIITTFAGNGTAGYTGDGGQATSAEIDQPLRVAVDSSGNIYFSDPNNNVIRKVTMSTGIITTVAGNGTAGYTGDGGQATNAEISNPYGVAVDGAGNIYISDRANSVIRKVTASTGIITTVAGNGTQGYSGDGGAATSAAVWGPPGVAVDSAGNIYIADLNNDAIRKVSASTGIITTVAGNHSGGFSGDGGPATSAALSGPAGVAVDGNGNLYIADKFNNRIRVVGGTPPINLVQSTSGFASSVSTISQSFSAANTQGNLIIAFVRMSTTSQTVSVMDSAGNTYVDAVMQGQTADGSQIHIFYAKNIQGGSNSVTATFSTANNHPFLAIYEVSGLNATSPLDQVAGAQGSSSTASSGLTPNTTAATELVFAGLGLPSSSSLSAAAGSGFNLLQQDTTAGTSRAANEDQVVNAIGQYAGIFALGGSANWSAVVATFKQ